MPNLTAMRNILNLIELSSILGGCMIVGLTSNKNNLCVELSPEDVLILLDEVKDIKVGTRPNLE